VRNVSFVAVAMDNASWQGWDNEYNRAVYLRSVLSPSWQAMEISIIFYV